MAVGSVNQSGPGLRVRAEVKVRLRDAHLINASLIITPAASLGVPHSRRRGCACQQSVFKPRAVSECDKSRIIWAHCEQQRHSRELTFLSSGTKLNCMLRVGSLRRN